MSLFSKIHQPLSLKKMAYDAMKSAIMAHKFEAGNLYNEGQVSKELGISKTPIHHALIELESEGFITLLPRKGFQIRILTESNIRDLYAFRIVLEIPIIRSITPNLTQADLVSIEKIFKKDEAAVWKRNIDSYLKIDREFHLLFANLHNNHFMINAMENVRDLVDWSGFRVIQDLSGMLEIHQEHAILLKALRDRDPDAAEVAMLEHLKRGEDRTLKSSLTLRMN